MTPPRDDHPELQPRPVCDGFGDLPSLCDDRPDKPCDGTGMAPPEA